MTEEVEISRSVKQRLEQYCGQSGQSVDELLRQVLSGFLQKQGLQIDGGNQDEAQ
jgi:hypothetical protein